MAGEGPVGTRPVDAPPIEDGLGAPDPQRAGLLHAPFAPSVRDLTLDGGWDRQIRTGRLRPERTVDLHGYGRDAARALLEAEIVEAHGASERVLLVVTGKGKRSAAAVPEQPSGVLRASLPDWLDAPGLRPLLAALRPAHPRHGGSGAWYVILKRRRA